MRHYHQFKRKIKYAEITYKCKKQHFGQEKPEHYQLLLGHFRWAIKQALTDLPLHHKELYRDKYFSVTYDMKNKLFQTLSLRTAKIHVNRNHKDRLKDILAKRDYLK